MLDLSARAAAKLAPGIHVPRLERTGVAEAKPGHDAERVSATLSPHFFFSFSPRVKAHLPSLIKVTPD
jgi:hypothetical protein